ncbi:MAG TPA: hypothetical protein VG056_10700 [Pirellulales bacterium]|jgi:hypothetical protein|nr:hypothetical protein [Pirellulales bacterium]
MSTMLQVSLTPETVAALRERANARGEDIADYAARLLRDAVTAPSVDELLAPFRNQVDESGATDEELDNLCEELRQEVWRDQEARKAKRA